MLTYVEGSLFRSPARLWVNTVNTVGVMGKGIAKDFKALFPDMFVQYQELCESGKIGIGQPHLYRGRTKWVLNFPTKRHWRQPSKPEYIEAGLRKFVERYTVHGITSVAFPRLGCGNGELNWDGDVRPLMEKYLSDLPIDVYVHHYDAGGTSPEHVDMRAMKMWLRTEPESLSFAEVWDDFVGLCNARHEFTPPGTLPKFHAEVVDTPVQGIRLLDDSSHFIAADSLLESWQNLRANGFLSSANLVDGLDLQAGRVLALFAALPYVIWTRISIRRSGERDQFEVAVQYHPRAGNSYGDVREFVNPASA